MNREIFEENFIKLLKQNFNENSKYFNTNYQIFFELNTLVFEINKCLILEFDRAAITLTNYFLERLLKLALIYNEIGIGSIEIDKWDEILSPTISKFDKLNLGKSIELCKKNNLINSSEKDYLWNIIRDLIRNGFSHAESNKILSEVPNEKTVYKGSLYDNSDIEKVTINQKLIPEIQALLIEDFAKAIAKNYFDFVYKLSYNIEKKLNK